MIFIRLLRKLLLIHYYTTISPITLLQPKKKVSHDRYKGILQCTYAKIVSCQKN